MNKPYKWKVSIQNGYTPSRIKLRTTPYTDARTGYVGTKYGYVIVYSERNIRAREYYSLDFIWNGVKYTQTGKRFYSKQYLVTLAKRFAKSVVEYCREES